MIIVTAFNLVKLYGDKFMRHGVVVALLLSVYGCGSNNPSESEIKELLSQEVNKKGCARSSLLKSFPIDSSAAKVNKDILMLFADAGLLEYQNKEYLLTDKGQAVYDSENEGFCYTSGYTATDIKVLKEESKDKLPTALSGAWLVSFKAVPNDLSDWINTEGFIKNASLASDKTPSEEKEFTIRVAKKHGEEKLILADARFRFSPGMYFYPNISF
ncbi:hypothetical protein [Pseudoalteromonas sp. G4]|uniref:hypothetical protein n=1 Tax=Pseudoalteromonas sp. G4 TaxID=2992761 RepID=UPI00237E84B2|nr:hypothetical protein [Pseudoalteromonas sp. G4]MDE3274341.1 hypothetical protein [Pseudoalteromonas sp. G4]